MIIFLFGSSLLWIGDVGGDAMRQHQAHTQLLFLVVMCQQYGIRTYSTIDIDQEFYLLRVHFPPLCIVCVCFVYTSSVAWHHINAYADAIVYCGYFSFGIYIFPLPQ